MSVDTDGEQATSGTTDVVELGRELGDAIAELPEYEAFEEARDAVRADEAVQAEIQAFQRQRIEFVEAREAGEADEADLAALQTAQEELHAMSEMDAFLDAQSALVDRLEDVNRAISEPLAVDFGGEAGGCCHD